MSSEPPTENPPSSDLPGVVRLRAEAVDWREVDGEIVALDRASSVYLAINSSGAAMWPALVGGATIDELVDVLVARFEVEPPQARADVEAFVGDLAERRLLQ